MVVQHNITAMNANRYFGINNKKLSKSLEKLSSGYSINRAGDNAAGLAVSEKMRSQIAGMTQAVKNAQDGISMVQTFEGALTETDSILQRMKTLASQMANGGYDDPVDRTAAQQEFYQLNDELNQIADTDYNGVVVLNGGRMADGNHDAPNPSTLPDVGETGATSSLTDIEYSGGDNGFDYKVTYDSETGNITGVEIAGNKIAGAAKAGDEGTTWTATAQTITINGVDYNIAAGDIVTDGAGTITGTLALTAATAPDGLELKKTDVTLADLTGDEGDAGTAMTYEVEIKGNKYYTNGTNLYDSNGVSFGAIGTAATWDPLVGGTGLAITGATYDATNDRMTFTGTITFADLKKTDDEAGNVSVSDSFNNGRRNLTYADSITLQVGARSKDAVKFTFEYTSDGIGDLEADLDCSARGLGTDQLTIASQEGANYAINKVSMVRATFGAVQNRLEHKIDNLNVNVENMTSAESRIRDTNMAEEMMNFTKNQILSQASQSMLAQANQLPQSVLQLLQ